MPRPPAARICRPAPVLPSPSGIDRGTREMHLAPHDAASSSGATSTRAVPLCHLGDVRVAVSGQGAATFERPENGRVVALRRPGLARQHASESVGALDARRCSAHWSARVESGVKAADSRQTEGDEVVGAVRHLPASFDQVIDRHP